MQYVIRLTSNIFECYSDMVGYDYIVRVGQEKEIDKAMGIAERELLLYGCPDEAGEDHDYYFYSGYVEVVENALNKAGIEAVFFSTDPEKEDECTDFMIIAASAGCGKTTLSQKYPDIVADIESSAYKYLLGNMTRAEIEAAKHTEWEDNPEFPQNYISAIDNVSKTHKIVCVWLNRIILPEYDRYGIPYILCYPDHEAVVEYRQRFIDRGNNNSFINHVMDTYDYYIDQWKAMPGEHIVLHKGETLESRLKEMNIL